MHYGTLTQALQSRARSHTGMTLIESGNSERAVPYSLLHQRALRLLGGLQGRGLRPGDELVLFAADNWLLIEALWACLLGGIVPALVAANARPECRQKLRSALAALRSPALFTGLTQFEMLSAAEAKGIVPALPAPARILIAEHLREAGAAGVVHRARPDDVALVQFSSGSTGESRGIALTHGNILTNIRGICQRCRINGEDTTLSWMPLNHDMGLVGFHLLPLVAGCPQHILPADSFARRPLLWLEKAAEKRATLLGSPNFGYRHYLRSFRRAAPRRLDLSAVRLIFNGGEPISAELCGEFSSALAPHGLAANTLFPAYGLAEATLAVAVPQPGAGLNVIHAERDGLAVGNIIRLRAHPTGRTTSLVGVGRALGDSALRIVDDEDRPLPDGHIGHVQIGGGSVAGVGRADHGTAGAAGAGWRHTGDIGTYMDALFIVGRSRDIIVVNGRNFHPHDIERICAGVPGVEAGKVACVGIRRENAATDSAAAFVQFRGAPAEFAAIAMRVRIAVNESAGLLLAHVLPVRTLPMTSSGKMQRFALRDSFERGAFDEPMPSSRCIRGAGARPGVRELSAIERELTLICRQAIEHGAVAVDDNLFDLGADSLVLVSIHQAIDSSYPDVLKLEDFLLYPSIAALARHIAESPRDPARPLPSSGIAPPPVRPKPIGRMLQD